MGQVASSQEKPTPRSFEQTPWHVAGTLMVGITLWMSSMDELPPEAYTFYLFFSRITMLAVLCLLGHRMYDNWAYTNQVRVWNKKQTEAAKNRARNHGEVEFSKKNLAYSIWDSAARAHPSAFLSTSLVQPRLFPFPVGTASKENHSMVWESGLQPQLGRFKPGDAYETSRREAYSSMISERLRQEDKANKDRGEYYTEQRRIFENRIHHLKLLTIILILSFASFKLAILALVPFIYSLFTSEVKTLLEGKRSQYKGSKRPRALKQNKPPGLEEEPAGVAVSYMYQPQPGSGGTRLDPLQWTPMVGGGAPVLLTSDQGGLAGDGQAPKTLPTEFSYPKEKSSRSRG